MRDLTTTETQLLTALAVAFGADKFDATDVVIKAGLDRWLAAALDAAIADCRYRSGWRRGRFRTLRIRTSLRQLPARYLCSRATVGQRWDFRLTWRWLDAQEGVAMMSDEVRDDAY